MGLVFLVKFVKTVLGMSYEKTIRIIDVGSVVCQLALKNTTLLVSCYTKVEVVELKNPVNNNYKATMVGQKLRKGVYGASFDTGKNVLCARKGKRLWEAKTDTGKVSRTIRFEEGPTGLKFGSNSPPIHVSVGAKKVQLCKITSYNSFHLSWGNQNGL
eukprot:UN27690